MGVDQKVLHKKAMRFVDRVKDCYNNNESALTLLHSFNKIYYKVNQIVNAMLWDKIKVHEEPMLKSIMNYLLVKCLAGVK
mmetsp:Transcript_32187/g.70129  ORF Transcript_32187/g.70129 Transcript_32187/m.70129 type:complete len:80 (+) Transcript_32187:177-416(+)